VSDVFHSSVHSHLIVVGELTILMSVGGGGGFGVLTRVVLAAHGVGKAYATNCVVITQPLVCCCHSGPVKIFSSSSLSKNYGKTKVSTGLCNHYTYVCSSCSLVQHVAPVSSVFCYITNFSSSERKFP
jgi:hypothetical protein